MPMYFHSQKKALVTLEKRLAKFKSHEDGILIYVLGQGGVTLNVQLTFLNGKSLQLPDLKNEAAIQDWVSHRRLKNIISLRDDIAPDS